MDLCPLAPAFGVEIPDVQLSCFSMEFVTNVPRLLLVEHKLLVFRGQRMSRDARVLRAVEVSRSGGDTVFADMRQAWRRLPDEVRRFIGALGASHDVAKCAPQDRREQTAVGTAAGRAPRRQAASGDG